MPILVAWRVLSGVGCAGAFNTIFPLLTEFATAEDRARVKRDLGLWWQAGVICLVSGAFLLRHSPWQALSLLFAPALLVGASLLDVPESPRWLAARGRTDEAMRQLQSLAVANTGSEASDAALSADVADAPAGLPSLFARGQAAVTLGVTLMVLVASGTYYGLAFAPGAATGVSDVYASQLLATLVELPSVVAVAPLADRLGRKRAISLLFLVTAAALAALAALATVPDTARWAGHARLVCLLLGRCAGQGAGVLKWVVAAEAFPTSCRATGLAWVAAAGQLGGFLAPRAFGVLSQPLLAFAAALLALPLLVHVALPETGGRQLS